MCEPRRRKLYMYVGLFVRLNGSNFFKHLLLIDFPLAFGHLRSEENSPKQEQNIYSQKADVP